MVGPFCGDTDERRRFAGFLGDGDGRFFGGEGLGAGAGAVSVVGLLPPHIAHCRKPASAPSWRYVQAGQAHAATSAMAHKCVLERFAMRSQHWRVKSAARNQSQRRFFGRSTRAGYSTAHLRYYRRVFRRVTLKQRLKK